MKNRLNLAATHWGNYRIGTAEGRIKDVQGASGDEAPSSIGASLLDAQDSNCRIAQPMIRETFLNDGLASNGTARGSEAFVPVGWDEALDIAADALLTTKSTFGNESIYGGSYGWASAGRFHHAQSQIHRFLNMFGGYVSHRDTYSVGAGARIIPRVLGMSAVDAVYESVQCEEMIGNTELLLAFGGLPLKNCQVNGGGVGNHSAERQLRELKNAGIHFVNVGPIKDDVADFLEAEWVALRPSTDTAFMLGIAHTLYSENRHDQAFLDRYTVGFEKFLPYLLGDSDGVAKSAAWAGAITGADPDAIVSLARRLSEQKTLISVSWSLQRAEHGEQPWWMALVLAAMLGQIGRPGTGLNYGFGSVHNVGFHGRRPLGFKIGHLPQGENPVKQFIPVARIADMLLDPGQSFNYDGSTYQYPDIKAILWAGGNPFHHHQDINKLVRAWAKPQLIIVNEIYWNSLARRADIVFPVTSPLERIDIAGAWSDCWITPSHKVVQPFGQSRNDYDIYAGLAERLGFGSEFTENRSDEEWIRHLYDQTVRNAAQRKIDLPDFEAFWDGEPLDLSDQLQEQTYTIEKFRNDPEANPLPLTPSGKIEVFSDAIADFGCADCIGHPAWYEKREWLGAAQSEKYPLHLISNQPKTRLHSQLDHGKTSREAKIQGREVVRIHPDNAACRNIEDGAVVRIFNDRGSCLAAAQITENIRANVVELPTGAWYDPLDPDSPASMDVHGNPNVLTQDIPSSEFGQGCAAQSCLVEVEPFLGELPVLKVFSLPAIKSG